MGNLFHLQKCSNKGRWRVVSHYHYVIIRLHHHRPKNQILWFNYRISLQLNRQNNALPSLCTYFENFYYFANVIWNALRLWRNNDNNGNIRAGAKFDTGGGAETSFPLIVALSTNYYWYILFMKGYSVSVFQLREYIANPWFSI